jgi:capsular exopolysaccharide synthesis family protein
MGQAMNQELANRPLVLAQAPSWEHPANVPPPGSSAPVLGATALFRALRRRWLPALTVGLVCAAVAATSTWFLYPLLPIPKYTARTLLLLESVPPSILNRNVDNRADFATYRQTQAALIKSRLVLDSALNDPKVQDKQLEVVNNQIDPVEWLEKEIKVDYPSGQEILRISMSGNNPEELKLLVDSVTRAYFLKIVDDERIKRQKQLDQVQQILTRYEESLRQKRARFRMLAETAGSSDAKTLVLKQQFAQDQLNANQKELLQLRSELRKLRIELAVQQAKDAARPDLNVPDSALDAYIRADPALVRQLDAREELQKLVKATLAVKTNGENDPMVQKYRKDLKAAEAELEATRKQVRPLVAEALRQKARGQLQPDIAQTRERIALMEGLEQQLAKEVESKETRSSLLNTSTLDVEGHQREIAETEGVTKELKNRETTLSVELDAPSRVRWLEKEVHVSQTDTLSRKALSAALAGLFGLGLVSFIFGWQEIRCQRVGSADEVVHGLGMKLVGTMPALPRWGRAPALQELTSPGIFSDSADAARTVLMHAAQRESLRVLMVTSATAGEGKTSVACQLAASLARAGAKTLLIDGDLRNPAVHRLFDVPQVPGLGELLRGDVASSQAIRSTLSPDLWLLPAGRYDNATIQKLARDGIRKTLESFKNQYDFILVDSPPVLPVPDSLLLGQAADAVLLSVLQEVTRMPAVYAASQRLAMLGIRTVGIVVNGARDAAYSSPYYYRSTPARIEDPNV